MNALRTSGPRRTPEASPACTPWFAGVASGTRQPCAAAAGNVRRLSKTVRLAALLGALVLAACATEKPYRDAQTLLAQGRTEEGLRKLQEAIEANPRDVQLRATYLQARENHTQQLNEKADAARSAERWDEAAQQYQRSLVFDPNNIRARNGLANVERDRRHAVVLVEAQRAEERNDVEVAAARMRQIITENPEHVGARQLQRKLAERALRPPPPNQLAAAMRRPVTIEFKETPLRQVFEVLSRTSGLNFVFDKDVRTDARTTVFLRGASVASVINLILLTNQLEQRIVDANTIIIYPNTPPKVREYQQLVVRSFMLATADAKVVANTLRTIVRTRDVVVDEKLNMIIVRDSADAVRIAERLVALHDAPEPEVMLEVEILEIKRSRLLDLGIRWPSQVTLAPLASASGGALTLSDLGNLRPSTIGATIDPLTISARRQLTDTNLLANPRIRARNREKAKILIGDRVPTITTTSTASGFAAESVNYIDVGLKLDVEPTIFLDGEVAIKISLEVSNIVSQVQTRTGTLAYQLGTRSASTTLRLKDGENQVLAGLIQDDERSTANRIPGLGDAPVLSRLFGSQADDNSKTEIVLSITPRLIRNIQRPDAGLAEFDAGTESSMRTRLPESVAPISMPPSAPGQTESSPSGDPDTAPTPLSPTTSPQTSVNPGGGTGATGAQPSNVPTAIPQGVALPAPLLSWLGPKTASVGNDIAVQLLMQSELPIQSVPLTFTFDALALRVTSVTEGDFMKQGNVQTVFSNRVDPAGQVSVAISRTGSTGATALNNVLTVNLRTLTAAEGARLQLTRFAPLGIDGREVAVALPAAHAIRITP
jgi:general secretion pathway protein D